MLQKKKKKKKKKKKGWVSRDTTLNTKLPFTEMLKLQS